MTDNITRIHRLVTAIRHAITAIEAGHEEKGGDRVQRFGPAFVQMLKGAIEEDGVKLLTEAWKGAGDLIRELSDLGCEDKNFQFSRKRCADYGEPLEDRCLPCRAKAFLEEGLFKP